MYCNEKELGERCKRKASLRCPVGSNESNHIYSQHECTLSICISCFNKMKIKEGESIFIEELVVPSSLIKDKRAKENQM